MAEPVWGRGLVADLVSQGCQGSKACTEQGLVYCFPLAPLSLEDKTCEIWELWMLCSPGTASSAESCVPLGVLVV